MRKILALALAVILTFALAIPVFADGIPWAEALGDDTGQYKKPANSTAPKASEQPIKYADPIGDALPATSKRWIAVNIKVIYHLDIPECEVTCVNAGAACEFVCSCEVKGNDGKGVCEYKASYPDHDCTLECGVGHVCIFDNPFLTCDNVCECAVSDSKTIVTKNEKKLIRIADGYPFKHTAPDEWNGGYNVSGLLINDTFHKSVSKTYHVYYAGAGGCACDCEEATCDAECIPCVFDPKCKHETAICDNCKNGQGSNHNNHVQQNPESNTNYFCLDCGIKIASWNKNQGWRPKEAEGLLCQCPICN